MGDRVPAIRQATPDLEPLMRPRGVAVIGASPRQGAIGLEVVRNLLASGYQGRVYPVHPRADEILGQRCYADVRDAPGPVDLAVLIVPRERVPAILAGCAEKGVGALIVIAAGYREAGPEGARWEAELVDHVRRLGMRMLGPNCMGVIHTDPGVRLNATFSPVRPRPGSLGFLSQSGAFGVSIMEAMERAGLGFSTFVSTGNSADISSADLMDYWEQDEQTRVVALYLESFGDPRRFFASARRLSGRKPVVVVKSGRTSAGQRAASSHTGALRGNDTVTTAFLEQAGVLRAATVDEMVGLLAALGRTTLPRGDRVALLTNSGGPGIMAVDRLIERGLEVARLGARTHARLPDLLPTPAAIANNPIDFTALGVPSTYREVITLLQTDDQVDAILPIFVPPLMVSPLEVAEAIAAGARAGDKPVLGVIMAEPAAFRDVFADDPQAPPIYTSPEMAADVCAQLRRYARMRERVDDGAPAVRVESALGRDRLRRACEEADAEGRLPTATALDLLARSGMPVARTIEARTSDEAREAAELLGYPVVLKSGGRAILHRSDIGAVRTDLDDESALRAAYEDVQTVFQREGLEPGRESVLVQEQVAAGREVILGILKDPAVGPALLLGTGGVYVEVLRDAVWRVPPLSRVEIEAMIRSLQGYPLLAGARGRRAVAIETIVEVLARLSHMALATPEIAELDINPFIVHPEPERCRIVDARIRLERGGG